MTAHLDSQRHFGEYTGGTSDPRLVRKVDNIPPHGPHIPDPAAQRSVLASIATAVANAEATANEAAELWDALYAPTGTTPTATDASHPTSTGYNNPFRTGQPPRDADTPVDDAIDATTPTTTTLEKDCE